ncbi:hypothetical protein EMIT0194P_180101 [Pseudomonas serbica]
MSRHARYCAAVSARRNDTGRSTPAPQVRNRCLRSTGRARPFEHLLEKGSVLTRLCTDGNLVFRAEIATVLGKDNHAVTVGVQVVQVGVDDVLYLSGQCGAGGLGDLADPVGRFLDGVKAHRF